MSLQYLDCYLGLILCKELPFVSSLQVASARFPPLGTRLPPEYECRRGQSWKLDDLYWNGPGVDQRDTFLQSLLNEYTWEKKDMVTTVVLSDTAIILTAILHTRPVKSRDRQVRILTGKVCR